MNKNTLFTCYTLLFLLLLDFLFLDLSYGVFLMKVLGIQTIFIILFMNGRRSKESLNKEREFLLWVQVLLTIAWIKLFFKKVFLNL